MKKTTKILALVMALVMMMGISAMAANPEGDPMIRVNGNMVKSAGVQIYLNDDGTVMVPARMVSEKLGAKVSWNAATQTASIAKNGVKVNVTIGDTDMQVAKNGKIEKVPMSAAAEIKDGKTYVPVLDIADALGVIVDYSETYKTIGIYNGKLTAEQVKMLRALPYTQPEYAIGYEEAKARYDADTLDFLYGSDRDTFDNFANAREHMYNCLDRKAGTYYFEKLGVTGKNMDNDTFYAKVVDEAVKEIGYTSRNMKVEVIADTSCVYQADTMDRLTCAVRGIAKVHLNVKPTALEGAETAQLCRLGFTQLNQGVDMYIPVDIHMNTQPSYQVNIHSIVPAGNAY